MRRRNASPVWRRIDGLPSSFILIEWIKQAMSSLSDFEKAIEKDGESLPDEDPTLVNKRRKRSMVTQALPYFLDGCLNVLLTHRNNSRARVAGGVEHRGGGRTGGG
jgi:hypothetical protein